MITRAPSPPAIERLQSVAATVARARARSAGHVSSSGGSVDGGGGARRGGAEGAGVAVPSLESARVTLASRALAAKARGSPPSSDASAAPSVSRRSLPSG